MRVAVIGLFHREFFFIPLWQNYYGKLFGLENLYAIGDLQKDETFKLFSRGVNFINYAHPLFANHSEHVQLILQVQKELLQKYDVVIFAEADQFFIPDPDKYLNLTDYLYRNTQDYIKVSGWNVRQNLLEESSYNPNLRVLEQRKYWFKDPGPEDKLVIIRKPMEHYGTGFHVCSPDTPRDPDLFNIHLQKFDFNLCNCRFFIKTQTENKHPNFSKYGEGGHVWMNDDELWQNWLDENEKLDIMPIPEKFKKLNLI